MVKKKPSKKNPKKSVVEQESFGQRFDALLHGELYSDAVRHQLIDLLGAPEKLQAQIEAQKEFSDWLGPEDDAQ